MKLMDLEPELRARLGELIEEGRDFFHEFDLTERSRAFHPFVPSNYDAVLEDLLELELDGRSFLEWGSGTGVITIMADMLGFEAYGIELDAHLVSVARELAKKYGSDAKFAAGSLLPMGYEYRDSTGDNRTGTLAEGVSGYLELGRPLDTFDIVFGYPWPGEEDVMRHLMKQYGRSDALLMINRR